MKMIDSMSISLLFLYFARKGFSQSSATTPISDDATATTIPAVSASDDFTITSTRSTDEITLITATQSAAKIPLITAAPEENAISACNTCTIMVNLDHHTWDDIYTVAPHETDDLKSSVAASLVSEDRPFVISYVTALPTRVHTLRDGFVTTVTCCTPYVIERVKFSYAYEDYTTFTPSGAEEPTESFLQAQCTPTSTHALDKSQFLVYKDANGKYDDAPYVPENTCWTLPAAPAVVHRTKTIIAHLVASATPTVAAGTKAPRLDVTHPAALKVPTPRVAPLAVAAGPVVTPAGPVDIKPTPAQVQEGSKSSNGPAPTAISEPDEGGAGTRGGNTPPNRANGKPATGGTVDTGDGKSNDRPDDSNGLPKASDPIASNGSNSGGRNREGDHASPPVGSDTASVGSGPTGPTSRSGQPDAANPMPTLSRVPGPGPATVAGQSGGAGAGAFPETTGSAAPAATKGEELEPGVVTSTAPGSSSILGIARPSSRPSPSSHESAASPGQQINRCFVIALSLLSSALVAVSI